MRIVITGSHGWIGSRLMREIQDVGHVVTGVDTRAGADAADASDPAVLRDIFREARPELVIHFATNITRATAERDVMESVRDHVGMTAVIAQLCGQRSIPLVYGSSTEVYGDNGITLLREEQGPFVPPRSLHGYAQLWGEQVSRLYAPEGLQALRFGSVYGPELPVGRSVVNDLLFQAHHGMPLKVHRRAQRSFMWIDDAVRAARVAIERGQEKNIALLRAGDYNIVRDDEMVVIETVAQMACNMLSVDEGQIELVMERERTLLKRPSGHRLAQLGWQPTVDLKEGMERTYNAWIRHLDIDGNFSVAPKVPPTPSTNDATPDEPGSSASLPSNDEVRAAAHLGVRGDE